jgi:hypothetical protein
LRRRTASPSLVDRAERDPAQPTFRQCVPERARRRDGVAWQSERTRQHARPAARQEAVGQRAVGSVQRLVVRSVAREDEDRVDRVCGGLRGELGRVPGVAGELRVDVDVLA